ncbi:dihydroneopterin aldolase [Sulfitobacter sp. S190]|uniref:dihydroneopterin aldolase n=1 Tax=Sulfitobacter sp. S190 TaxID=2867022 RepID=UPI0021A2D952|nr:dihydroneopterin aldolase [Sulfitobacter sp. S190]UWR21199.1 dihydroneopterin aldolase [Sulfitobacter sp. S190]
MTISSSIELRDMILETDIGTYGPNDARPDHHLLDLTLHIASQQVLIPQDGMEHVFDYDPLVADIKALAATGHRETQEWLMTQIVRLCAQYLDILGVEVYLRKFPVSQDTGTLGVRLRVGQGNLAAWRVSA